MRIFLVAGKAGSGKADVARFIKEYYIYKIEESVITEYSKYIKMFARELTDWDGQDATKPRRYLQQTGAELRKLDPNYFTRRMIEDIDFYKNHVSNVIIDDVRMPNEIETMYESFDNVYSFCILNQFAPSKLSIEEQADITETALEGYQDFDYTIINDNNNTLRDKVFKILEEIE
jgi:dephospho-CoA kinase